MRKWLRGILQGPDGNTSISNFILFVGFGATYPLALVLLILDLLGWAEWPTEGMDWLFKYTVAISFPYVMKKIGYMTGILSYSSGIAPDGVFVPPPKAEGE